MLVDRLVPLRVFVLRALTPGLGRLPPAQPRRQLREAGLRVANHRQRPMLVGIEAGGMTRSADSFGFWNTVQEPVLKSCSRVPTASTTSASAARRIGRGGADDAEGRRRSADGRAALMPRPAMVSATGMLWRSAKVTSSASAKRIVHARPGDEQRLFGLAQQTGGGDQLLDIRPRARHLVNARLEELDRIVERLGLKHPAAMR